MQEFLNDYDKVLDDELERLYQEASKIADVYWEEIRAARKNGEFSGGMGVRVRKLKSSLQITWYKNRYIGGKGERKVMSDHIVKGRGVHRYSMQKFTSATPLEQQLIEVMEERFSKIRHRAEILGKMKRSRNAYSQLAETQ